MAHPGKVLGWDGGVEIKILLFIYLNAHAIQVRRKIWKSEENQSKILISLVKNEGMESTEEQ